MSDDSSNQSFPFKFSFKLLVYKSYIKLSSLRRRQARRKQALKKTKALKEKDGKNEIRFSKTGFPILMIFQGACLQKLHQTKRHWKWKIGRKEDKPKLPIYIFLNCLFTKGTPNSIVREGDWVVKSRRETLTNVDITCLQMQMIGVGK